MLEQEVITEAFNKCIVVTLCIIRGVAKDLAPSRGHVYGSFKGGGGGDGTGVP